MSRRVRAVATLALALVVLAAAGVAGAAMTGADHEPAATIAAGTLKLDATGASATSAIDATNLRPGRSRSGVVTLKDAGSVAATVWLGVEGLADVPAEAGLSHVLALRVEDADSGRVFYDGGLASFAGADLGAVAAGAERRIRVTLSWDAAKDDPRRQGAQATATLVWRAVAGRTA